MCVPMLVTTHVETVVKLSLKKDTPKIEVIMKWIVNTFSDKFF